MPRPQFADFLPGRSCRFLLHFHYDKPSPKPDDGCPGGPLAYGLGSRFPRPERKLRSELHYFAFQKLPENRTGFFKHLRIFSKVYYFEVCRAGRRPLEDWCMSFPLGYSFLNYLFILFIYYARIVKSPTLTCLRSAHGAGGGSGLPC